MKLKSFITLSLLGYAGYQAYRYRDQITETIQDFLERKDNISSDLDNIRRNLEIINQEKNNIQQISQDLSYKFRVFGKETQAHLDEINRITSKYKQVK